MRPEFFDDLDLGSHNLMLKLTTIDRQHLPRPTYIFVNEVNQKFVLYELNDYHYERHEGVRPKMIGKWRHCSIQITYVSDNKAVFRITNFKML